MSTHLVRLAAIGLCLLAAGCEVASPDVAGAAAPEEGPVCVPTLTPTRSSWPRTTTQPATVHADFEARIFARASGYLTKLDTDLGQRVQQGQTLAVIDTPEMHKQREARLAAIQRIEADQQRVAAELAVAQANVTSAEAQVEQVQAEVVRADANLTAGRIELDRARDLVQRKAVADRLLDEVQKRHDAAGAEKAAAEAAVAAATAACELSRAKVEAAKADEAVVAADLEVARRELEELETRISFAQLKAPFDGVVTRRHVELGDLVQNAQSGSSKDAMPLFVVSKVDRVRVRVPIPERDAPLVDEGDPVQVTLQSLPGEVFEGSVSRCAGGLDENTRTMTVEVDLPNPEGRLLPGSFGQATVVLEPEKDRLVLPSEAVRYDEKGRSYVYVVDADSKIQIVDVTTGLDDGEQIEITAGLKGTERVVGPLLRRLKAGQPVRVE